MKKYLSILMCTILTVSLFSCSDSDDSTQPARVSIRLVDAPGDYDNVFIDIQDVMIKYNDDGDEEVEIGAVNTGVYDLLELTGGASVILADDEIPAGRISQIRLVLGDDNTVVVDGQTFPLSTPSAQQSGLKLNVNQDLEGGIFYEFILDFDADKSIVQQGNGGYSLKPVIRTELVAQTGAISGTVVPTTVQTLVTATDGVNTISTFTNSLGEYRLSGVPEGTYTVTLEPDATAGLQTATIADVQVTVGQVTAVGETQLN
ncbi:DUF4382 domain-containing protein [Nonlabens marinus]|uniref:Probable lipoprotein n=1 Tax=Nonlabens marinus S1-08 TaxID=1454201 RepID=W8VQB2_9FLAO|nr:DUF4382 domain-containing protein [Nonlabens marinus]BAO55574.1 probable lipoprotein [Nonlabens marinus S1-08]